MQSLYFLSNFLNFLFTCINNKLQPCLMPISHENGFVSAPLTFTLEVAFNYISCKIRKILLLRPIMVSFFHRRVCSTESKALAKSTKQAYTVSSFTSK